MEPGGPVSSRPGYFFDTFCVGSLSDSVGPAFRVGRMWLGYNAFSARVLGAGETVTQHHHYCLNDVVVRLEAAAGYQLVQPKISQGGGYDGVGYEGTNSDYGASGEFYGHPFVGAGNGQSQPYLDNRADEGWVGFSVPQGTYHLLPSATIVDASLSLSSGNFVAIDLTVGCGQRVALSPELGISLDAHAGCVDAATLATTLSGRVTSQGGVDRIWYVLDGGPPVDSCSGVCGPTFSRSLTIAPGSHTVTVFASSAFAEHDAQFSDTLTTCDPCAGATCPGNGEVFWIALTDGSAIR